MDERGQPTSRDANADMVEGYKDGLDLTTPEPSANRTHSYRHGFEVGRADRAHVPWKPYDEAVRLAEEVMEKDEAEFVTLRDHQ